MSSDPINKRLRGSQLPGRRAELTRAIATELARIGCDVMINYVANEAAADETCEAAKSAGGETVRVSKCRADIAELTGACKTSRDHACRIRATRLSCKQRRHRLSETCRIFLKQQEESFDRLIRMNLKGPYFLSQSVASLADRTKRNQRMIENYSPAIINITSVSAFAASPERGDYCVSKAGLGDDDEVVRSPTR